MSAKAAGAGSVDDGLVYSGDDRTCLVGEELNAVSSVMDYVEFHFN
jgi:hypothetical protein